MVAEALLIGVMAIGVILIGYSVVGAILARGDRESTERTLERAGDRLEGSIGFGLTTTRILAATGVSIGFIAASQLGAFAVELGAVLSAAPLVSAQLGTIGLGLWSTATGNPAYVVVGGFFLLFIGVVVRDA